jgi:hypothetical protein
MKENGLCIKREKERKKWSWLCLSEHEEEDFQRLGIIVVAYDKQARVWRGRAMLVK